MTDQERAHAIVERFRADGHPYYDELLGPIEAQLATVRQDERRAIAAWIRAGVASVPDPHRIRAAIVLNIARSIERGAHEAVPRDL